VSEEVREGAAAGTTWAEEGVAVARAATGGLLFGVPLLYTMEVWWIGAHTTPAQMLLVLGLVFVTLLALNTAVGFRRSRDLSPVEALEDALLGLAVGLVVTAAVLLVLRQVRVDTPTATSLGRVVTECIPFCLGVGVARFLVEGDPGLAEDDSSDEAPLRTSGADVVATALGAAFIGLSIAPTDEVPMLAAAIGPAWQVVLIVASLALSYAVVFVAGFSGQDRRHREDGIFQRPVTETLVTYLVALLVGAALLWVFQRDLDPASDLLGRVVVLGLPASVGGGDHPALRPRRRPRHRPAQRRQPHGLRGTPTHPHDPTGRQGWHLPLVQRLRAARRPRRRHDHCQVARQRRGRHAQTQPDRELPADPAFADLFRQRNDAESINRNLEDTMFLRRAHSVGAAR
jgi:putative integral membrane protein (TIGR02587 family)